MTKVYNTFTGKKMSNYITVEGLCFDLDKLSDAGRKELHEATGERSKQGEVTPVNNEWVQLEQSLSDPTKIFFDVEKFDHTPGQLLTTIRALTVAVLEKLGVVGPTAPSWRPISFGGFESDGEHALARLDDLIQGVEQQEN